MHQGRSEVVARDWLKNVSVCQKIAGNGDEHWACVGIRHLCGRVDK